MKLGKVRTMASINRQPTPHTNWCARDHRCGIVEHRAAEIIADELGGRVVITRVRAGGTEYLDVRGRIALHGSETGARWQVAAVLRLMRELLAEVALRSGVLRDRQARTQVGSRGRAR